ncbi:MAG TPA: hypothetical protein VKR56_14905 [Candidatus Cybelea sp.]|jgi:hypothetical protein|nr:hypothetical protein [Candidatus Cybelea sp.]
MDNRLDQLIELIEAEPEGLQAAEFLQAREILQSLVGKTVTSASVEDTRIAVSTSDGCRYHFYGFLGCVRPD